MASFQAKTGRKTQRNGEYKNYRSFRSYPTCIRKYQKNGKKNSKIPLWHHFKPKQVGKGQERDNIKSIVAFRSYSTRNRKFQKNSKKIQKTKKYRYGFLSSQNRLEKAEKERK